jgi:DNA-directed RNA polymerase specialized sigma24 family protein
MNNPDQYPKGRTGRVYARELMLAEPGPLPADDIDGLIAEAEAQHEVLEAGAALQRARARLDQAELLDQIRFEVSLGGSFQGRDHRRLFDDLWLYAWPVLKAFLRLNRIGQVHAQYARQGWKPISPEDLMVLAHSEAERDALVIDVITRAVKDFHRNAIMRSRWRANGGAALRTWFIGTCALNFPRAYVKWSRERADRLARVAGWHGLDLEEIGGQVANLASVADTAVLRDELKALIDLAKPDTKTILGLLMQGMTQAQVAAELGLTPKKIERRLWRFRQRVREDQERQAARLLVGMPFVAAIVRSPRGRR